jgi:copper oxidase (laccase) domain-containing protein
MKKIKAGKRTRCIAVTHAGRQCLKQSSRNSMICSTHINAEKRQIHVKVG